MINVALISHSNSFAGAEKMLFSLACSLQECETYYPIVYLPQGQDDGPFLSACQENNLDTYQIPPNPYYIYTNTDTAASISSETIKNSCNLSELFLEHNIGIVVCNTMTSIVPILAARKAGVPCILWVHGILDAFFIPASYDLGQRLMYDRLAMHLSDAVVCCSQWTEDYYRPFCTKPISTICNWSVDEGSAEGKVTDGVFACLNTFDPHKGVKVLLEAALILRKASYKFKIELHGSGPEEAALREFVQKNNLEKNVFFCGRTNDVGKVYSNSFCLVQPSSLESFGLTITEAMSYSRPVIAVASGGPKQIVVDGETGFLVPPNDAEALAEKMAYLLDHSEQAVSMGKHGRERYKAFFSPERAKQEFLELFEHVLATREETSEVDQLIDDLVWDYLRVQTLSIRGIAGNSFFTQVRPYYAEELLCFSGPIAAKRSYGVTCSNQTIGTIAMLFACHDPMKPHGEMSVRLLQKNREIGRGKISLDQIISDTWTDIKISEGCRSEDGVITVELSFMYEDGSGRVGVYENWAHRNFLYKVFNKLGLPLKGKDALIVQFQSS